MKLKTSIILCSLAATTTAPAFADTVWDLYGGIFIGAGAQTFYMDKTTKTDAAQSFGGVFGIDIPVFRAEVEYNYLTEHSTNAHIGFVNAYVKMPSTVVKPYLGGGVGMLFEGRDSVHHIDYEMTAAYQGMLGLTFSTPALPLVFDVEGRAIYMPNVYKAESSHQPDVLHYEARVKVRYLF